MNIFTKGLYTISFFAVALDREIDGNWMVT